MDILETSIEEIKKGFRETEIGYHCLFCDKNFQKGKIYKIDEVFYDAYGAILKHIEEEHESSIDYLLNNNSHLTGLSESQIRILKELWNNKSDKEISKELGLSSSTVRNYRFKFKEKQRQAKIFLAIIEEINRKENNNQTNDPFIEIHTSAIMVDDRYDITESEYKNIVNTYFDKVGKLKNIPSKQKKIIVILSEIIKSFESNVEYNESNINEIIKEHYSDFATIRRYLIQYGFLERSMDGQVYKVKANISK